jgi:hypothetical protein
MEIRRRGRVHEARRGSPVADHGRARGQGADWTGPVPSCSDQIKRCVVRRSSGDRGGLCVVALRRDHRGISAFAPQGNGAGPARRPGFPRSSGVRGVVVPPGAGGTGAWHSHEACSRSNPGARSRGIAARNTNLTAAGPGGTVGSQQQPEAVRATQQPPPGDGTAHPTRVETPAPLPGAAIAGSAASAPTIAARTIGESRK